MPYWQAIILTSLAARFAVLPAVITFVSETPQDITQHRNVV